MLANAERTEPDRANTVTCRWRDWYQLVWHFGVGPQMAFEKCLTLGPICQFDIGQVRTKFFHNTNSQVK